MQDNFDSIISRNTLFWLLVTNVAVLTPQFEHATAWTLAICAICFVWRVGIYFGKVAAPPKLLVTLLAIGAAITLGLVSSQIGLLNALINLLLLGYALKYIEMRQIRDVKAVVLVGYFIIALTLLDQQTIINTLHLTLVVVINTCVLISIYQDKRKPMANALFSFKLILHSIPLAILLFVVFPRLGPLWLVPSMKTAKTGLSNELSFGDITNLTRSAELAFRVGFENPDGSTTGPANTDLYWRTLVMENYDGTTWRQDDSIINLQRQAFFQNIQRKMPTTTDETAKVYQYTVISEPSHQKWLYGLDEAFSQDKGIVELPDYRIFSIRPVDQRQSYRVSSFPNSIMDAHLSDEIRQINTRLPAETNPQTWQLAQQFKRNYPEPKARVSAMMNHFAEQQYFYTLTPQILGEQQIDDFLFNTQAGFCAHYASALVFLARASGLPARMVTGYQGGEYNPKAGYYSVYQYMAHAWTEVWIEGEGWQRFDPTAMIAPERILDGFDATFDSQTSYLQDSPFSTLRLKQYPWLNELRNQIASLDYYWSVWVLGFDEEHKQQLLQKLLGEVNTTKIAIMMLVSIIVILLFIAYFAGLLQFRPKQDPINRKYHSILQRFSQKGLPNNQQLPPVSYLQLVEQHAQSSQPGLVKLFTQFTTLYVMLKYQPLTSQERVDNLKKYNRLYQKLTLKLFTIKQISDSNSHSFL
ncbi:transglutaminaseTgpA domain-containing protein [Shewanella gaetbuli]|uniref:DUF3488 and transglutaminase-like domain-containing protein n=1 Tax=Shewanella gaetbuli TaxID=220752 RepID=A0A9X1ZL18_9GAMM|nr:DUF3488 and transglutaminase-like domain-containing protein [Shewanella gaetbuli]MCL1142917.1 DUF3488 and transglutaminase-like domain-containing protein [Shewanella gaetbuli]